ncbi:MAG: sulfide dehydrogenase [flavocytochrome c] flavoprotein chain [Alphaproteobacteria bacterium]|jgi:sulfide dehydrogenase [flavocytochrome c] flavoprotein subunit|nr:sulfide dehydrogenase [flavocytochrome c] flavoprotein chain [Alphaproteobacteria bacterium]
MTAHRTSRRDFLKTAVAGASAAVLPLPAIAQGAGGRVVVVGGGFGGATCARFIRRIDPRIAVTLVEASPTFTACPFSNLVIVGLRELKAQEFGYDKLAADQVTVQISPATAIDTQGRNVTLGNGASLPYDRLVLSPGIDIRWDGLPGYTEAAAERMPHAWKAGEQTLLLRRQLEAMEDGGTVVISAPANPFRCPPGPYERASLIAYYLKTKKPKSKLIVLDAKDAFSKQGLFQGAWKALYPNLEWVSLSSGGKVTSVDAGAMTLVTDFARHKADVANVIPPQKAGRIAEIAGAADRTGWCPIDPATFESKLQPNIHVIGDASIAGAMPKSAFTANAQAKVCAAAVAKLIAGGKPDDPRLINTCYSLVAPDYGISVAGVYRPADGQLKDVEGSGGVSPINAPASTRAAEATFANGWFSTITQEVFG